MYHKHLKNENFTLSTWCYKNNKQVESYINTFTQTTSFPKKSGIDCCLICNSGGAFIRAAAPQKACRKISD
jgi:hypothetical protein